MLIGIRATAKCCRAKDGRSGYTEHGIDTVFQHAFTCFIVILLHPDAQLPAAKYFGILRVHALFSTENNA